MNLESKCSFFGALTCFSKKNTVEIHEEKKLHNICYRRERWETPNGENLVAPLPQEVQCFECRTTD